VSNSPLVLPRHPESSLVASKLDQFNRISTEILEMSLLPGQKDSLKTRPDGTILDGHHRHQDFEVPWCERGRATAGDNREKIEAESAK
jgi:hypothetical protein